MRREYLPIEILPAWQQLNGIFAAGVEFQKLGVGEHGADKGSAIVATEAKSSNDNDLKPEILLQIPNNLVLSLEAVKIHAKSDHHLRDVLGAVGDFGRTPRGAILIFLLLQLSHSSPNPHRKSQTIGVTNPWTEYVKFLPSSFPLPTLYTTEERELLRGTSLAGALDAKLVSLEREFDQFREATEGIPWCQQAWWDESRSVLTLEDWKYVDAAYRSRMLDLPGSGLAMVPCVDMANHTSGDGVKALYDADSNGDAILQLRWGQVLQPGDEVTISYGDEKPASEMLFSYGFLETDRTEAREILLNFDIPEDDPLGLPKKVFCQNDAGIRIIATQRSDGVREVTWKSAFTWLACVNEEDGLQFGLTQTIDGGREMETTWKGETVKSPSHLLELLAIDPLWKIFQLRATVLLLERLETQLVFLQKTEKAISALREDLVAFQSLFRPGIFEPISLFRKLEAELLKKAIEDLIQNKMELLASETVTAYLQSETEERDEVEDFS